MARILVTGGAGFIGSNLCIRMMDEGHKVTVVDDLSTGRADRVFATDFRRGCVSGIGTRNTGELSGPFDEIWHMASPASPRDFRVWDHIIRANVLGLMSLRSRLADGGLLVVAGSSEAYGRTVTRMSEDNCGSVTTQSPRGVYDECKRMLEAMAWQMSKDRPDARVITPRIFNTYGPNMPLDGRAINTFVHQAKTGGALTVHGDGLQTRSFCFIDDTVDILLRLRDSAIAGENLVVNVGNDEEVSVLYAAEMVRRLHASDCKIVHLGKREADPTWRQPCLKKLQSVIGPTEYTDLSTGVARCV